MDGTASWRQSSWDWRAAGNFIGGGTGSGLAIWLAIFGAAGVSVPASAPIAAVLAIASGLSLVWLEIGRPWRFVHVFFHPRTSWMTRESLIALPLLASLIAFVWLGWRELALAGGILAASYLYAQARILKAARGIPAWREPAIVPLILATGLAEGIGVLIMLMPSSIASPFEAMALALGAVVARWIAWRGYRERVDISSVPLGARAALRRMEPFFFVLGATAPAALLAIGFVAPASAGIAAFLAGLSTVAAGWLLKFAIVTRAGFNQGFAVPRWPTRGRVAAGMGNEATRSADHG